MRVEHVQLFPATLYGKGNRDAKVGLGEPNSFCMKLFTRRDVSLAVWVGEVNDIAIAV